MSVLNGQFTAIAEDLTAQARQHLQRSKTKSGDNRARAILWREAAHKALRQFQAQQLNTNQDPFSADDEQRLIAAVLARLQGTAGLTELLADPTIEDIWVQGCDNVWVHRTGTDPEPAAPVAASDAALIEMIRALAAGSGPDDQERRFDRGHPVLDLRLPGGERLHALMEVCPRPSVSIRRHRLLRASFTELQERGVFDADLAGLLTALLRARANLVISGATGAGKTTLLRALASLLPPSERLVTIEDTWELDLAGAAHPNAVALQGRQVNIEGAGEISLAALFRSALRMNPSRVIVGEVRGDELVTMLHAMNQGNNGSLSTLHASSSLAAFSKMALFGAASQARLDRSAMAQLIADGVDFVIHLDATPAGERVIASVREVVGSDGDLVVSNETFKPDPVRRRARANVPPSEAWRTRLDEHGWHAAQISWGRW